MTEFEKIENYITLTSPHEDAPGQWTVSAEIIFKDPLSGGREQNMGGFQKRGFKTKDDAENAALDWSAKEIYRLTRPRP